MKRSTGDCTQPLSRTDGGAKSRTGRNDQWIAAGICTVRFGQRAARRDPGREVRDLLPWQRFVRRHGRNIIEPANCSQQPASIQVAEINCRPAIAALDEPL